MNVCSTYYCAIVQFDGRMVKRGGEGRNFHRMGQTSILHVHTCNIHTYEEVSSEAECVNACMCIRDLQKLDEF